MLVLFIFTEAYKRCLLVKQQSTKLMGVVKQIDIKNRTYYFCNDIIDRKNLDARLLKIDKKSYKNIGIYNIGYSTI